MDSTGDKSKMLVFANEIANVISDLVHSKFNWHHVMQSGWPVFALIAWCSRLFAARAGSVVHALPPSDMISARTRLRYDKQFLDKSILAPHFWGSLAAMERSVFDARLLAEVAIGTCSDGMYCGGERSPNRYTCRCERIYPRTSARAQFTRHPWGTGLCVITTHHVKQEMHSREDLMQADFGTLSAMLNMWYAILHKGSFHWRDGRSHWCKVRAIREVLASKPDCKWMAWIDSDAYFATTESMEAVAAAYSEVDILLPQIPRPRGYGSAPNVTTHFMLFRVSSVVQHFFDLVWELPRARPEVAGRFLRENFYDQSVINLVLNGDIKADLRGLRVGYLRMEDFGQYNSRMVMHEGGLKVEGFRRLLLHEVFVRLCRCHDCRRSKMWRYWHDRFGNSTCSLLDFSIWSGGKAV